MNPNKAAEMETVPPTNQLVPRSKSRVFSHIITAVILIVVSPMFGICWRLILISSCLTYYFFMSLFHYPGRLNQISPPKRSFIKTISQMFCLCVSALLWLSMTPVHVVVPTMMDLWTPYVIRPAFKATEVIYDPGKSAKLDIIAIHGLGSNPDSAWAYKTSDSNIRWLKDLLPMVKGLPDFRVIAVNHQTRWDSNTAPMRLQEHASELLDHIQNLRRAHAERPIIFIAHSFGGILLKKALILAKARSIDIPTMTKGIFFLGVPHMGTDAAFFASCLSCMALFRGSSTDMLELMAVDGPTLLDLESEFYDAYVAHHYFQRNQPFICDVFEKRPETFGRLVLGFMVRQRHRHHRHGKLLSLDTDHRGLNKFQSHDDPNFQIFIIALKQAFEHALQTKISQEGLLPLAEATPILEPAGITEVAGIIESASIIAPINAIEQVGFIKSTRIRLARTLSDFLWIMLSIATIEGLRLNNSWRTYDYNNYSSCITLDGCRIIGYTTLISSPLGRFFIWILQKIFEGRTTSQIDILQIFIGYITVTTIHNGAYIVAKAFFSDKQNFFSASYMIFKNDIRGLVWDSLVILPICMSIQSVLPITHWVLFINTIGFLIKMFNTITQDRPFEFVMLEMLDPSHMHESATVDEMLDGPHYMLEGATVAPRIAINTLEEGFGLIEIIESLERVRRILRQREGS